MTGHALEADVDTANLRPSNHVNKRGRTHRANAPSRQKMIVLATFQPRGDSTKALVYNGPCDVAANEVEDPRIERLTDVLVRITRSNICGSGLHMHEGGAAMEPGRVLGRENMGEVGGMGSGIDRQAHPS